MAFTFVFFISAAGPFIQFTFGDGGAVGMGIAGTVSCYQNQFAGSENKMLEEERMKDWLSLSPISVLYF